MTVEDLKAQAMRWAESAKKILTLATPKLRALGFERARSTFFVRERQYWCEFIHAHKFTGGRQFRLHAGIRILASPSEALILNGPETLAGDRRFFLSFVNSEDSWERCSGEFPKFASLVAQPWFDTNATLEALLAESGLLDAPDREALTAALRGETNEERLASSRKLLGLKAKGNRTRARP